MTVIRPAEAADLEAIAAIHTHYVLNTVITFTEEPLPKEFFLSAYESILSHGLPYLVAVDESSSTILGYANAHPFRTMQSAYRHTVEISLFCHPDQRGKGVGSLLLRQLISVLRDPAGHPELCHSSSQGQVIAVKQVLAVMSVDEMAEGKGLRLKEFYERFGFEMRGHLRHVGYKFGRW
ncbi:GNAT family N-acetyltransferase [Panus rudis PR-1116 ss-1]|nr:GNAT family N-acetyltransferase [Panus rudis PR-1116 ss-1]